jgi:hypothetical protein|nr:MAG TPA: hypothetical protein [Caudoviricetes sp.]
MKEIENMPTAMNAKNSGIQKRKVELKNVLFGTTGSQDITAEVIPFNRRNDDHVEFAYAYSDMLFRAPSEFENISQAARKYVALFMVHRSEDELNPESNFNKVLRDLRACRILFNQAETQKEFQDFFENA